MNFWEIVFDWSEVWALLVPLTILILYHTEGKGLRALKGYIITGFILNLIAICMVEFYQYVPGWMYIDDFVNNNIVYNIHSLVRVLLLSSYILAARPYGYTALLKAILAAYLLFILINFTFFASPFYLDTKLFAAESIVLLIMCFACFFHSLHDESHTNWLKDPAFIVCTGICLYEVLTFFIFLFFYPLSTTNTAFFVVTMRIYTGAFILLCILLAVALYQTVKKKQAPATRQGKGNLP